MKTTHNMNLNGGPFTRIKNGTKAIEIRLNDEKRQLLKVKDLIKFTNKITLEVITVEVIGLYKYSNFEELYKHSDKIAMGYDKDDIANPKDMEKYYSKEKQEKYGVIGIEIRVI
ncbi:MAG: ASCH domain-containing protein [Bacilli bacterium]|nr:ASCH domain-containing protein [Bacilli bacterium]